jgi:hypothetical protein
MVDVADDRVWCGVRLGAPAVRALNAAGVRDLTALATRQRAEVGVMHGMGPTGLRLLDEALASAGLAWHS